jgi:CRP-like cAMP-binding protein
MSFTAGSLEGFPLFAGLPAADVEAIASRCRWLEIDEGALLFDLDTDTLEVYFVLEGALRILTGRREREVALADVLAGNYFGELAAIDGRKRSARVVATAPSRLASLDGDAFRQVLLDFPAVGVRVLERLARIIRSLDQRVTELSTTSESTRVCGELVRLAQPDPHGSGWLIPDLPNHAEIATWVGSSREAVAQAIGELARDGVVRRRGIGLIIADWPRLQLLARA